MLAQCQVQKPSEESLQTPMAGVESIQGSGEYLQFPYLTAGDRVYLVGHQNGQFPDLGWHIAGEMGGIWNHPIKLMDGFTAVIHTDGNAHCLSQADTFINYPFANKHIYALAAPELRVERFQFVPDGKEAVVVEYTFINKGTNDLNIRADVNAYTDLRPTWLGERSGMVDGKDHIDYDATSGSLVGKDSLNAWYVVFGSDRKPAAYTINAKSCQYTPAGKGSSAVLSYELSIPAKGSALLPVYIAGSYQSLAAGRSTFADVQEKAKEYLLTKKDKYEKIAERAKVYSRSASFHLPDSSYEAFSFTLSTIAFGYST